MRALLSSVLLSLVFASQSLTTPSPEAPQLAKLEDEVLAIQNKAPVDAGAAAGATNSEAVSQLPTVFNGIEVPPMKELTGEGFVEEVKDGYWYGRSSHSTRCLTQAIHCQILTSFANASPPGLLNTIHPFAVTVLQLPQHGRRFMSFTM